MRTETMQLKKSKHVNAGTVAKVIIIMLSILVILLPLVFLVGNSVKPNLEMYNNSKILPSKIEWDHYKKIFSETYETGKYFMNSIVITVSSTVVAVLLSALAAYGLNKLVGSKVVTVISALIIIVRFYPKITIVIPYFLVIKNLGLLDSRLGIILSHISICIPLIVMMLTTFYKGIPKEIEESAAIDGAGIVKTFFSIIIPMSGPALAAATIITAMTSWNEFLIASSIAAQKSATMTILISGFITDKGSDWGAMSALSVICIVPITAAVLIAQKYLVQGLTAGAVKG